MISVGMPVYNSCEIVWLAMEGLCRQKTSEKWELIICEDEISIMGENFYNQYTKRLQDAGCVNVVYLKLDRFGGFNRVPLSMKWKRIAEATNRKSIGLIMQDADDYSPPNRIQETYKKFKEGYDWIHCRYGLFYYLQLSQIIKYDYLATPQDTGVNKAVKIELVKRLPEYVKWQSIDSWIFSEIKKIKKIKSCLVENICDGGIFTDGKNNISDRIKFYTDIQPPFKETDVKLSQILPFDVCNTLVKKFNKNIIKNCYVARAVKFFGPKFCERWNLTQKIDKDKPLIVLGCYDGEDYDVVLEHSKEQKVIIYWAGSDALRYYQMEKLLGMRNIFNISASAFTNADMEKVGLKYKYIPLSVGVYNDIKPEPLGDKIYVYTSRTNPGFYGRDIYERLVNKYGEKKFIITTFEKLDRPALIEAYKSSFVGLRLVNHDGLSETVAELGLMGRNVIYNGDTPNSLNYDTFDDICRLINQESQKRGIQLDVCEKMKKYLDVDDSWLKSDSYSDQITVDSKSCELSYELISCIPFAYWLNQHGLLKETISSRGSESLYYFSPKHTVINKKRYYNTDATTPNINIHKADLDMAEFIPPPYKEHYKNDDYIFSKPIVCICNRYKKEYNGEPVNYFSLDMLDKLFNMLKDYQVIYWAVDIPEALRDTDEYLTLNDRDFINKNHKEVIIFQDLIDDKDWNTEQMKIFANCDKFITLNGGYSVMASYFGGQNIIYSSKTRESGTGSFSRWYPCFGNSQIICVNNYDQLINKVGDVYVKKQPTVNVLIRTHKRPNYLEKCIESIEKQDYKNINIVIGTDTDEYINHDYRVIRMSPVKTEPERPQKDDYGFYFPFNHYLDEMSKMVNGYIICLDDDDMFNNPSAVSKIVSKASEDKVIFWRVQSGNKIYPSERNWMKKPVCQDISGIGFMYHSSVLVEWGYWKRGDYRVASKLYKECKPVYINEILTVAQTGSNQGSDKDIAGRFVKQTDNNMVWCEVIDKKFGPVGRKIQYEKTLAYMMSLQKYIKII